MIPLLLLHVDWPVVRDTALGVAVGMLAYHLILHIWYKLWRFIIN